MQVVVFLLIYLFTAVIYTYVKTWLTDPGYPEKVATAAGDEKLSFTKRHLKKMSPVLRALVHYRNKGFVSLLNSGSSRGQRRPNQCFKCDLKPLKPQRCYHCSTCERDIIFMNSHCVFFNNCIGLNNYRYFLGFLVYLSALLPLLMFTYILKSKSDHHNF